MVREFDLKLSSGVMINLVNCCYASEISRNIISFHALYKKDFQFSSDNEKGDILVYKDGCFIFKASPCNGIYESVGYISNNRNVNFNIDYSNMLAKSCLWNYRLFYINKKHNAKVLSEGILESFDLKSDEVCKSFLHGKINKSPFITTC